ncbi:hypothetical protein [Salmonella enterica]|nr:hypothetical protein [Salmonella enterica]
MTIKITALAASIGAAMAFHCLFRHFRRKFHRFFFKQDFPQAGF